MRSALLGMLVISLSACVGSPAAHPQATPSPSPIAVTSPIPSTLFVLVRTSATGGEPDSVAIAGLDGRIRGSASFLPRKVPVVPTGHVVLQDVAQVEGSSVYYIDGAGTVRVWNLGSEPRIVASFSQAAAQVDIWFAVSPDGSRLLAGILTLPPVSTVVPGTSWTAWDAQWDFKLMTAVSGSRPVYTGGAGGGPPSDVSFDSTHELGNWWPTFPVAWTQAGPVAMYPVAVATDNTWPGGQLQVVRVEPGGIQEDQLGGDDCFAATITAGGLIPCISSGGAITVRDAQGNAVWPAHVAATNAQWLHLSPNGFAITDRGEVETRGGAIVTMPSNFHIEGWLDDNTLVGRVPAPGGANDGDLAWISLGNPTVVHDLGFEGHFIAPLA